MPDYDPDFEIEIPIGEGRECGTCAECCYALGIEELEKPQFQKCPHVIEHNGGEGCGIYGTHPPTCKGFSCGWLQGEVPIEFKPVDVGLVVFMQEGSNYGSLTQVAESRKGAMDSDAGKELRKFCRRHFTSCVVKRWYRKVGRSVK